MPRATRMSVDLRPVLAHHAPFEASSWLRREALAQCSRGSLCCGPLRRGGRSALGAPHAPGARWARQRGGAGGCAAGGWRNKGFILPIRSLRLFIHDVLCILDTSWPQGLYSAPCQTSNPQQLRVTIRYGGGEDKPTGSNALLPESKLVIERHHNVSDAGYAENATACRFFAE